MDLEFRGSNPLTYIVGEHARAVLAIQDLQREVNALLNFRDYVLHALPHLKSRAAPEGVSAEGTTQAAPHSAVVDSGFSTDKASTSMGKSSSFSGAETCPESRWSSADHEETLEEAELNQPPLGSCEDELWQLLEVIQRKGTRLRTDLERAEMSERENLPNASESNRQKSQDFWPHSLPPPGPGHRYDYYGFEPFAEMDRLRLDRSYLLSRISKAETEAAMSHSRLIDLHAQMMGLSSEKRRLEDALNVTVQDPSKIDNYLGYHSNKGMMEHVPRLSKQRSSVTVNSNESQYHPNPTWGEEDIMLPRILKVPIRDKGEERIPQKTRDPSYSTTSKNSPGKTPSSDDSRELNFSQTSNPANVDSSQQRQTTVSQIINRGSNTDRVVIERQRACSKVDGGLSMPTSLLKGNKIKVNPDKQRISAILREKDVLALRRQLLTTVMETEVLKRQLECCSEEWVDKCSQFEQGQKKNCDIIASLNEENRYLKHKLETFQNVSRSDVGITAKPAVKNTAVSTENIDDTESTSMYEAPNVKYDVVVHEDVPKSGRAVEKPPRKRALAPKISSCSGDVSFGSKETVSSPRGNSRGYPKPISSVGSRVTTSSTPSSSLTRHSRSSSSSLTPIRRDMTARIGPGSAPPLASLRNQPFNKVPFLRDTVLALNGGAGSIVQKSGPESLIPRATPQTQHSYSNNTGGRHLPKAPLAVNVQAKYLPIDKTSRVYSRYSTGPGSGGSGIPSLIRGYTGSESPKPSEFPEEQDRSDCSVDERNPIKGTTESVRHKTLWRKSSGAVRMRNVGRPSVMSYLGKDPLG